MSIASLKPAGLGVVLAAAVEPIAGRAAETAAKYGIPVFPRWKSCFAADLRLDAVSVAVPTVQHHAVASQLLEAEWMCWSKSRWPPPLKKPMN